MSPPMLRIPPLCYTIQNVLISLAMVFSSISSLVLTASVILPLSLFRAFASSDSNQKPVGTRKTVLVMGATSPVGISIVRLYAAQSDTDIIAVGKSLEDLNAMAAKLDSASANIHLRVLDASDPPSKIRGMVAECDRGLAITHMYAVSDVSNHFGGERPDNLDATVATISINLLGTVNAVTAVYECMKKRASGRICIVVSGSPNDAISFSSTTAFIKAFAASLRTLALKHNIEVITPALGYVDPRLFAGFQAQGNVILALLSSPVDDMALKLTQATEKGDVGVIAWPVGHAAVAYALQGFNPVCDEIGRYLANVACSAAGKKEV